MFVIIPFNKKKKFRLLTVDYICKVWGFVFGFLDPVTLSLKNQSPGGNIKIFNNFWIFLKTNILKIDNYTWYNF